MSERSDDFVSRFLSEAGAALEATAAAADRGDVAEVALMAHDLQGRSEDFATATLAALCADLERSHDRRQITGEESKPREVAGRKAESPDSPHPAVAELSKGRARP
ncbi:MAG TPA: Hpt domain-containing protein [Acidimicrobiales bacterium]|nr:Hpt domain-containing protein [Acidimicrobiales bacterium]